MATPGWANGGLLQQGYPDNIGRKMAFCGPWNGPKSYSQTTKDVPTLPSYNNFIDALHGSLSVSGTYSLKIQPSGAGPRQTWKMAWFTASSNTEVANGVDLSGETVILSGFGSVY